MNNPIFTICPVCQKELSFQTHFPLSSFIYYTSNDEHIQDEYKPGFPERNIYFHFKINEVFYRVHTSIYYEFGLHRLTILKLKNGSWTGIHESVIGPDNIIPIKTQEDLANFLLLN